MNFSKFTHFRYIGYLLRVFNLKDELIRGFFVTLSSRDEKCTVNHIKTVNLVMDPSNS